MAVVKCTRSGRALLFVDNDGRSFVVSWGFVDGLRGRPGGFVVLTELPGRVSPSRFPVSPLWNPDGVPVDVSTPSASGDAMAALQRQQREAAKGGGVLVSGDLDEW